MAASAAGSTREKRNGNADGSNGNDDPPGTVVDMQAAIERLLNSLRTSVGWSFLWPPLDETTEEEIAEMLPKSREGDAATECISSTDAILYRRARQPDGWLEVKLNSATIERGLGRMTRSLSRSKKKPKQTTGGPAEVPRVNGRCSECHRHGDIWQTIICS